MAYNFAETQFSGLHNVKWQVIFFKNKVFFGVDKFLKQPFERNCFFSFLITDGVIFFL